jgi:hypothetical protein
VEWYELHKKASWQQPLCVAEKHKCLTTNVIQYIQKCFSYAVAQNKNNSEGLAKTMNQIVPHAFG